MPYESFRWQNLQAKPILQKCNNSAVEGEPTIRYTGKFRYETGKKGVPARKNTSVCFYTLSMQLTLPIHTCIE